MNNEEGQATPVALSHAGVLIWVIFSVLKQIWKPQASLCYGEESMQPLGFRAWLDKISHPINRFLACDKVCRFLKV